MTLDAHFGNTVTQAGNIRATYIGSNVNFADTALDSMANILDGNTRTAMQDQRNVGQGLVYLREKLVVELGGLFIETVLVTDGNGERINASRLNEFNGLLDICIPRGRLATARNMADLRFDEHSPGMSIIHDALGNLDILFKRFVGTINHH